MIQVQVNHETKEIPSDSHLTYLLQQLEIPLDGIAVAVNNEIITKKVWNSTVLNENDAITIIQATQGG